MLKNHFKTVLFVFALLLSIVGTQTCFGSQSDDLIQTGSVSIINTLGAHRQTFAQVQILYKIPANGFQNALSISDFANYNTANGLDLQLRGGRVGNSSILGISLILLQDSRWTKTIVWYIVSSRSDMWIGEWTENIFDLNAGSDSSSSLNTTVSSCICNWIPDNTLTSNYTVYVFISGIVTQLSKFNVSLNNIRFDKVKGSISTNLVDASKRIEQITFSYVVFLTPHPKFDLFSTNNPSYTRLNVPDYNFKGSIGFWQGVSNLTYTNWLIIDSRYSNCIGTCGSQCISNTDCVNGKRGILQNKTCYICPAGTQADFKNKACSPVCKANEEFVNGICVCIYGYSRIVDICVNNCGVNQVWNGNSCDCILGTSKINGVCRKCPPNALINQNKDSCICPPSTTFDDEAIVCANIVCVPGTVYNSNSKVCESICKVNEVWNSGSCVCKSNFYRIGSNCLQCQNGTGYNSSAGICVACGINQITQDSLCVCKMNTYIINGVCGVCDAGFSYNLNAKKCESICKINQEFVNGVCLCKVGTFKINGVCGQCSSGSGYNAASASCLVCGANEVSSNSVCICKPNTNLIKGVCGVCQSGSSYDSASTSCISICKANENWNGNSCVCNTGYFLVNGVCSQCAPGTGYQRTSLSCVACAVNQITTNSLCVCKPNTVIIKGVCGVCPDGTTYNSGSATCTSTNSTNSTCGVNQVFNGTACVCISNFYRINGVCSQCSPGFGYNNVSSSCIACVSTQITSNSLCICPSGTHLINGVCSTCPSNQTWVPVSQCCMPNCGVNQAYDGTGKICVCTEGFNRINGTCVKCSAGTYFNFDQKKCISIPTCPLRSQWDSNSISCQCTVDGQHMIDNKCQTCVANAGWNEESCVCLSGYFMIGSVCLTCDVNSFYSPSLKDCVCNRGFYGNRTLCQKCHSSCGKCTGPNANQCIDCIDVSYTLSNGSCTQTSKCITGMYLSGSECQPCMSYCINCIDGASCNTCTNGFTYVKTQVATQTQLYCGQICGDGKKYQFACDDGNNVNGDGCNANCQIQNGWSCNGGSSSSRSICIKGTPSRSFIIVKGAVQDTGRIYQGVTLSYIPPYFTADGCINCHKILKISVIKAQLIPSISVSYLPTTQYKFLINYDFRNAVFSIPKFTVTIRIDPVYSDKFSVQDMAQIYTITIDSALLAKKDPVENLTLEDISVDTPVPTLTTKDMSKLFK